MDYTPAYDNRKESDKKKEKIVHEWLENNLWNKFPNYKSNDERNAQLKGVDCEFDGKHGFHYICDEKAVTGEMYINPGQVYYTDKNGKEYISRKLNTFCLELSMRSCPRGTNFWKRYEGWMLRDEEINNCFCFVWIDRTKSGSIISVDDILEAQVIVVKRDRIMEYFKSKGWDKERLRYQVQEILSHPDEYNKSVFIEGLKFSYPERLRNAEAPVNILLTREDYAEMAEYNETYKFD